MKQARRKCQACGGGFKTIEPYERRCASCRPQYQGEEDNGIQSPGSSATVWVPRAKLKLDDWTDQFAFAHDAANECAHGALPHDRKKPEACRCWGFGPVDKYGQGPGERALMERRQPGLRAGEIDLAQQRAARAMSDAAPEKRKRPKARKKQKLKAVA